MSAFSGAIPAGGDRVRYLASKRLYIIVFPTVLLCAASLAGAFQTETVFGIASAIVSLIGAYAFGDLLFGRSVLGCAKVIAVGFALGYGLTSCNTWLNVRHQPGGLSAFVGLDQAALCGGIAAVAVSCASLFALGDFLEPAIPIGVVSLATTQQAKWFVITGFAAVMYAFLRGDLTYMGQTHNSEGRITILGTFAVWLIPPLFGITVAVVLVAKDRLQRLLFWALVFAEAVLTIPLGRRVFVYTLFIGGFVARFCPILRKGILWKRILVVGLGLAGMYVASIAFLYLRFAAYELDPQTQHTLRAQVSEAYHVSQTKDYAEVAAALRENTVERGFILGFLADLIDQSAHHRTGDGQDLFNQAIVEIPAAIWKGKSAHLPISEEDLANLLFGTNFPDQANSIMTTGAVDFGIVGALVYPFIVVVLMAAFLGAMRTFATPLVAMVSLLSGVYLMLNTELDFSAYLAFFRNGLLFAGFVYLVGRFRPAWRGTAAQSAL